MTSPKKRTIADVRHELQPGDHVKFEVEGTWDPIAGAFRQDGVVADGRLCVLPSSAVLVDRKPKKRS